MGHRLTLTAKGLMGLAWALILWATAMGMARADGMQALQDFLQHNRSGRADFVQKVTAPPREGQTPRVKTSRGSLAYQRPDQFRLDYTSPDEQTLLADGRQFWHLDTDLRQVTVRPQKSTLAQAPAALVLTAGDLRELQSAFDLRALPDADGLFWVEVIPRSSEGTLRQLRVGLRGQGTQAQVVRLEFTDGFGQSSRLELSGFVGGPPPASTFVLKPPAGFQVLRP
ncbi:MAG: outer rane lipoprotein carrier protein LolA [Pseudomonadota bacterium]